MWTKERIKLVKPLENVGELMLSTLAILQMLLWPRESRLHHGCSNIDDDVGCGALMEIEYITKFIMEVDKVPLATRKTKTVHEIYFHLV